MRVPFLGVLTPIIQPPSANLRVVTKSKKLIVPVGAAIATLIASVSYASKVSIDAQPDSSGQEKITKAARAIDPVLKQLMYRIGENVHSLTLHKSASGTLYAQHYSHSSHGSHSSHRSHRSSF